MTRARDRLTAMQVKNAKDGWYNDGAGLHLRVNGNSKKWVLRYARGGKVTEIGLGSAADVPLKQAREERDRHRAALAKGIDPRAERRKARAATEAAKTFAEAAAEVIALRRQKKWRANASDGRESSFAVWTKSMTVDCQKIADRYVGDIDADDIKPIVRSYFDNGHEASGRRLLNRIEIVFDYAKAHRWRKADNPATWDEFQHILQAQGPSGPKSHHPALDWRDLPAFMARLRASEPTIPALALEMMILTATRSGEARGMLWSEINFDDAVWTIPAERMKRKLEHQVPLSEDAVALIRRLEAARINKYVFPGRYSQGPVTHYPVWALVHRLTGQGASPHGFRASFRSWCTARHVPGAVAERCLAHGRESAVEEAYDREEMLKDRREWMEKWAAFLSGADAASVTTLRA